MHVQNLMNSLWDIRIFLGPVPKESPDIWMHARQEEVVCKLHGHWNLECTAAGEKWLTPQFCIPLSHLRISVTVWLWEITFTGHCTNLITNLEPKIVIALKFIIIIIFLLFFFIWDPSAYASGSTSDLWLIVLSPVLDFPTFSTSSSLPLPPEQRKLEL
jgi:hypothetical protein